MRSYRFYGVIPAEQRAWLDAVESRHLSKVLRLNVGDEVQIFDGQGQLAEAQVEQITRDGVQVRILQRSHIPPKTSGRVVLAVSMAKGERFEWLVEKCTELGADHIAAVQYHRTVKMGKQSALERWQKIALAAAKQSERVYLPTLSGPESFESAVHCFRQAYPNATLLYGDPEGQWLEPGVHSPERRDWIVCIGPEGGFSKEELALLRVLNAQPVRVNPHILRIETAAVAFTAVLSLYEHLTDAR